MLIPYVILFFVSSFLALVVYCVADSSAGIGRACWVSAVLALVFVCSGSWVLLLNGALTSAGTIIVSRFYRNPRSVLIASSASFVVCAGCWYYRTHSWLEERRALREQFPFVSMEDRLDYEQKHFGGLTAEKLQAEAQSNGGDADFISEGPRAWQLKNLHDRKRDHFILASGFGNQRMIGVNTSSIKLPEPRSISIPQSQQDESRGIAGTRVPEGERRRSQVTLPSKKELTITHRASLWDFLDSERMGYIRNRREVAGFEPHRFERMPKVRVDKSNEREWQLTRLELISLLRYETPRVYVSKDLPRMDKLKEAPTRALDPFESRSLPELRTERDIVIKTELNRIRMLGSLRARQSCLKCHSVPQGTLLGAFSYELRRTRPIRKPAPSKLVTSF